MLLSLGASLRGTMARAVSVCTWTGRLEVGATTHDTKMGAISASTRKGAAGTLVRST